jgi:hypothetical protein
MFSAALSSGHAGGSGYSSYIQNERGSETFNLRPTYRAYAETTGEIPPASGMKEMARDKHLIFHSMMADQT